jgi:hypothetical protein
MSGKEKPEGNVAKEFKQALETFGAGISGLCELVEKLCSDNVDLKKRLADAEVVIVDHGTRLDNADVRAGIKPSGVSLALTKLPDVEVSTHA